MKRVKRIIPLLMLLIIFNSAGCSLQDSHSIKPSSGNFTKGNIVNSYYKNEYFGISLKVPDKWSVQNQETENKLIDTVKEKYSKNDSHSSEEINNSVKNTSFLLTVFHYPLGTQVPYNANFVCITEKSPNSYSISSEKFLENTKQSMLKANSNFSFDKDIYKEELDGINFSVLEASISTNTVAGTLHQKVYATMAGDYALAFQFCYNCDDDLKVLKQIVKSIKFSKK